LTQKLTKGIATFFIMIGFWVTLSGKFDLFHLTLGVIGASLISIFSSELLFSSPITRKHLTSFIGFIKYIPWLIVQIMKANIHLTYLVFHPRMLELIDPRIMRFHCDLKDEFGLVIFANSITLTPGTITVSVTPEGDFKVHAIDETCAGTLPGEMERRIRRIFRES
jgi:multicomponent Na+:H+ antiporter subunit E